MLNRPSLLALGLLGSALLSGLAPARAATITAWDFNADTGAPNTTPAPAAGTGAASTLGFANNYATAGASTDISDVFLTSKAADQGSSDPLNTSAPATNAIWRVRGGTSPATAGIDGWNSAAPTGTQGAQFLTATTGFRNVQVQFDWYCTTSGEQKLQAQYTLNGTTFVNVPASFYSAASYASVQGGVASATNTMVLSNTASANTVTGGYLLAPAQGWTNAISFSLGTIPGANNDPNFGFRFVNATTGADDTDTTGAAYNNTSGNWRFDEVTISGTAIAAAPEPGTYALVGLGLAAVALLARRRPA